MCVCMLVGARIFRKLCTYSLNHRQKRNYWGGGKGELVELMNRLKNRFRKEKQDLRAARPSGSSTAGSLLRKAALVPFPLAPGSTTAGLDTLL